MSIIKAIENIELERENNRALREAMRNRMENLIGSVDAHLSKMDAMLNALLDQAKVQREHLQMLKDDIAKARDAMLQEMDNRDEALRQIIEGDGNA
jgi:peptidoglycan hydrolase CwlO-like protein